MARARILTGAPLAFLLALTAMVAFVGRPAPSDSLELLASIASLAGLVSPVVGYRLYVGRRDAIPEEADATVRRATFLRATLLGLGVTEGAALFGLALFVLTGRPFTLAGLATHLLLTGALWPSAERLEPFLERRGELSG